MLKLLIALGKCHKQKGNGLKEYNKDHIPNAIFFDLDKNSKIDTDLPHMLTDVNSWKKNYGRYGY